MKVEIGNKVRIIYMDGEPQYSGREGVVELIDSMGSIHGTWGGCAILPETDVFEIIEENEDEKI
jgi:hypothetical protein